MVKKTIFSLTLSLLLFASNVNAMDDAAGPSGGIPNLGRGIPNIGRGIPNLGASLSSGSDDEDAGQGGGIMPSLVAASSSAARPSLGGVDLSATLDDSDEEQRRAGRDAKERKHQDKDDAQPSSASASRSRDVDAHDRGLDLLSRKLGKSPLCPGVDPRDMLHASNMLYAKYAGYVKRGFGQLDAATLDPNFFAFLRTNGKILESVCDADMMRIFLGFMGQQRRP